MKHQPNRSSSSVAGVTHVENAYLPEITAYIPNIQ